MNSGEISLKDLILFLFKGWKIILCSTIIVILIGSFFVYFLNYTSYSSEYRGKFYAKDSYYTEYGEVINTSVRIDTIIALLNNNEFLEFISTDSKISNLTSLSFTIENQFDLSIRYTSVESNSVSKVMSSIKDYTEKYLDYRLQIDSISSLISTIQNKINIENKNLGFNRILIESYQVKQNNTNKFIEHDFINPAYEVILSQITNLELKQIELQEYIKFLNNEKDKLALLNYDSFESYVAGSNQFDEVSIEFDNASNDIHITQSDRFNIMISILISSTIGFMLGVFIVYFIEYWKSN